MCARLEEAYDNMVAEKKEETGLYVTAKTEKDYDKLLIYAEESSFYAEAFDEGLYVFFPEEPENYDILEKELNGDFNKLGINVSFEGV
jgi:hypothetical protein